MLDYPKALELIVSTQYVMTIQLSQYWICYEKLVSVVMCLWHKYYSMRHTFSHILYLTYWAHNINSRWIRENCGSAWEMFDDTTCNNGLICIQFQWWLSADWAERDCAVYLDLKGLPSFPAYVKLIQSSILEVWGMIHAAWHRPITERLSDTLPSMTSPGPSVSTMDSVSFVPFLFRFRIDCDFPTAVDSLISEEAKDWKKKWNTINICEKYAVTIQFGLKIDVANLAQIGRPRRYLVGSQ